MAASQNGYWRGVLRTLIQMRWVTSARRCLEVDMVGPFEVQDLSRFLWRGDLQRKRLEDVAYQLNLRGIGLGELPSARIERVLEAYPHVGGLERPHGDEGNLMTATGHHRPLIVRAKKLVRDALGMQKVFGIRALAAQNAEDRLYK